MLTAVTIPLTWTEALSGVFGSISLASWIFLLVPQLVENYRLGSADGISLTFLCIWFVGDVANLAGALWAGLVPTVTALAVYFCFADVTLIGQCLYYNALNKKKQQADRMEEDEAAVTSPFTASENTALLQGKAPAAAAPNPPSSSRRITDITDDNLGLPGSRRRSTVTSRQDSIPDFLEPESKPLPAWLKNTLSILAILLVGAAGWALAWRSGAWQPQPVDGGGDVSEEETPLGAEILGYASAVLYLGARIPQIVKNQRSRSCEGLSLLFFLLSLVGNATYGAGILFHSVERKYFLTNLPWLIGSLGTMVEDAVIFIQFSVFGEKEEEAPMLAVE